LALYAIGDLHLSFGTDKAMDVFGGGWNNYVDKIREGFSALREDDVCVLCGDTSWGMTFGESAPDFRFIGELPGKKIILKGNHDYWWNTVSKMDAFFSENGIGNISILNNNCYIYEGAAICGTRGWMQDGETDAAHNMKIMSREAGRLRASLGSAGEAAEKLCFFHYPPRFRDFICEEIVAVMDEFGVRRCWYGHIHGEGRRHAVSGTIGNITYEMISADSVNFTPQRIFL